MSVTRAGETAEADPSRPEGVGPESSDPRQSPSDVIESSAARAGAQRFTTPDVARVHLPRSDTAPEPEPERGRRSGVKLVRISKTGDRLFRGSAGAYPALLVTYEIVCSKGLESEKTTIVKDFLGYFASATAQDSLEELGYAPLPEELLTKVKTAVSAIQ